jgi:hypothetical protein
MINTDIAITVCCGQGLQSLAGAPQYLEPRLLLVDEPYIGTRVLSLKKEKFDEQIDQEEAEEDPAIEILPLGTGVQHQVFALAAHFSE